MNKNANRTCASRTFASPLADPFKDWPNSDLLIDDEDRAFFTRHYPAFGPIFDWPELRALFVTYDTPAAGARKRSRRSGIFAILSGFLSLIVAATVPLADEFARGSTMAPFRVQGLLGGIAAVLAIVSIVVGYTQVLKGREKAQWLTNRFWTERIRQFHFQLIVNHLPELIAAVNEKNALESWLDLRSRELDKFKHHHLRGVEDRIHHLNADEAEDHPWANEAWDRPGPVPPPPPNSTCRSKLLEQQRFGIQQRYTERKLIPGWHSPETRSQWVYRLSDTLTGVLLLATIAAASARSSRSN